MSGAEAPPGTVGIVIDVSKYQSSLPPLAGVMGVIARAGIGTKPDPMFTSHIAEAKAAGKWTGAYWFNWGTLSISEQVDAFIAREAEVGGVELHVLDWEGDPSYDFSPAQAAQFMDLYRQRTGRRIGLYASEGRFRDLGQDWNWIALYQSQDPPSKAWDMWQHGPYLGVDGNYAKQRILDLVKESQMTPLPVTTTTPMNIQRTPTWYNLDGTVDSQGHSAGQSYSPYGVQGFRAFVANGIVFLNKPSSVTPIPDPTPFGQADLDKAAADAAAKQKAADQAALDAAATLHAQDQAQLAGMQTQLDGEFTRGATAQHDQDVAKLQEHAASLIAGVVPKP